MGNAGLEPRPRHLVKGRLLRRCTALAVATAAAVMLLGLLGLLAAPAQAQPSCDSPTLAPYCGSADKLGDVFPWDAWIKSLSREPFNHLLCWGIYGHSGEINFDQPGADRYVKLLYMAQGDEWEINGHNWSWGVTGVRIQMWDPNGRLILDESLSSNQARWGVAAQTGEHTILFTPDPFLGQWTMQGKWSLYWTISFRGRAYSCSGGGCRPGMSCPQ